MFTNTKGVTRTGIWEDGERLYWINEGPNGSEYQIKENSESQSVNNNNTGKFNSLSGKYMQAGSPNE